jgi:quercetin dioxygenase-like cupin family protein
MEIKSWNTIAAEKLNESVTRQMIWGEKVMVTRVELAPHTSIPTHSHESEQLSMVARGSVTLFFEEGRAVKLIEGDMVVIPGSEPHGVKAGAEGCVVLDVFSPIRKDFIEGTASYLAQSVPTKEDSQEEQEQELDDEGKYRRLQGFLYSVGIKLGLDELKQVPLDLLARYAYEKECITLGELRRVLGLDKKQAKAMLREWKHGDDHSESSLKRTMERMVVLPQGFPVMTKK